jgi:alpha-L-rhamnosidase
MNMLDGETKTQAVNHLVELLKDNNYCLNTGFIGTPYLNIVLSDNGRDDVAYKMFQQTAYPSWIYPILQGATTIWERWNSYTLKNGFGPVEMNSFNHYSYGAIQDWMMAYSAGIQRDEQKPGYKHFVLQPRIGGRLDHVAASFESVYGNITSSWESDNKTLTDNTDASNYGYTYTATVPANTTATLILPVKDGKKVSVKEGKKGISAKKKTEGSFQCELAPGTYTFIVR